MGIPAWAVKGAKVVAVEAEEPEVGVVLLDHAELTTGGVYTIRQVLWSRFFGEPFLLLEEIAHLPRYWTDSPVPYEWGYLIRFFRPLVTKSLEQDSTMFRKLLQDHKEREPV